MEPEPTANSVLIVGRYALYDAIAAGGMATVHYGRLLGPVGFSRTVAIKRLHAQFARDPEFVSMFLDEARLAARIRHPNVVPTLDVVATDGELFLVMEYVPGESLARLVRTAAENGVIIPPRITMAIVCGLLRGLHAAHEATNEQREPLGIVHRDVSPQNVLVGIDGQARVLDFGVAKAVGRLQTTRDGKLKGKLAYMSPEQLRAKTVDRRTDIFAASVVLWEALAGRRLFQGDNEGAIITQILEGNTRPPSETHAPGSLDPATLAAVEAVDAICLKGLATPVDQRWQTAREMALALELAVAPAGVSEVSDWVEHFAKDVLVTRAQIIADIESNSSVGPPSLRTIRESTSDVGNAARTSRPSLDAETRSGVDLSVSVNPSRAGIPGVSQQRQRAMLAGVAAAIAALGSVAIFIALRFSPGPTPAAQPLPPATSAAPLPAVASAIATAPAASPTSSVAAEAPQPSAMPSAAAPSPSPAIARPAARPTPHPAPQPAPAPAAPNCSPPYTYDAQGLKHFKPECL